MNGDRVLPLEGVHNFRDYGGYRVLGGGRLKRGLLWRSGQHHAASDADLQAISKLALAAVFDLRSGRERMNHPCRRPAGFAARIHHASDPQQRSAPHVAAAQATRQRTPEGTRDALRRNYQTIAFRPELQAMTAGLIAAAADGDGATLVNCMAGKDRTGIAVAMLQLAVGVHRDDVAEDYLLTNTAGDVEARISAGMETIRALNPLMDEPSLRVLMGVEAEYLETAFAAVEERHGTLDTFLEDALGVDAQMRERLAANLVE